MSVTYWDRPYPRTEKDTVRVAREPITYWNQPYPGSVEHACHTALDLACVEWDAETGYDPHAGTFSNELAPRDPLSLESIRAARDDLNRQVLERLAPRAEPTYEFTLPRYFEPSGASWRVFEDLVAKMNREIRDAIQSVFVDLAITQVHDEIAVEVSGTPEEVGRKCAELVRDLPWRGGPMDEVLTVDTGQSRTINLPDPDMVRQRTSGRK